MVAIYGSYDDCYCYVDRSCMVAYIECFYEVASNLLVKRTWIDAMVSKVLGYHCIIVTRLNQPLIPCESKWMSSHDPCVETL